MDSDHSVDRLIEELYNLADSDLKLLVITGARRPFQAEASYHLVESGILPDLKLGKPRTSSSELYDFAASFHLHQRFREELSSDPICRSCRHLYCQSAICLDLRLFNAYTTEVPPSREWSLLRLVGPYHPQSIANRSKAQGLPSHPGRRSRRSSDAIPVRYTRSATSWRTPGHFRAPF